MVQNRFKISYNIQYPENILQKNIEHKKKILKPLAIDFLFLKQLIPKITSI